MNIKKNYSYLGHRKHTGNWSQYLWFTNLFGLSIILNLLVSICSEAPLTYMLGQAFLCFTAYISFYILANKPLFNPIQAFLVLFYWWFNIAPTVCGGFYLLINQPVKALNAQVIGMESLWIVAIGLPLYSIVARCTLEWMEKYHINANFLIPTGRQYTTKTILYILFVGYVAQILLIVLNTIGIQGQESIDILGGKTTSIWWVGVIDSIGMLTKIATAILVVELIRPWKKISPTIKYLSLSLIILTINGALFSGWKGQFVFIFFFIMCSYISKYQSLPWRGLIVFFMIYIFFIEPFVAMGRSLAENNDVTSTKDKENIYMDMLSSGEISNSSNFEDIQIESSFRGIYQMAGDITRNNNILNGEWNGSTIDWGLSILLPRVINPNKLDMNIGNFFYKTTYARLTGENVTSDLCNISISLPFEFVGNFGWFFGVFSFGIIGAFWAFFCGWFLSPSRLSTHPLSAYFISMTLSMEAPLGHYLVGLKSLFIPFLTIYLIRKYLKGSF